ncbi:MAG: sigma-54-dependent Fis family transcriptional regulator [Nitrospirae bacterium]|nr:MAG: sigma-54-dependent Fis family transcriptional regulator [Nitrospirota bacterium]
MQYTVLVVDDEAGIRESLKDILEDEGYEVLTAADAEEAIKVFNQSQPDLVYLDIWLPDRDGLEVLEEIKAKDSSVPVVMISGHGTIEVAVKATKLGAYDFLEKPLSLERVLLTAQRAIERGRLEQEYKELKNRISGKYQLVGQSRVIEVLKEEIERVSRTNSRVLITGESGTGKELVARLIHEYSARAHQPFIEVNCAAIPQELIESELFGHEKGSFTGAYERKKGKFELADKGTLFLDEIGDMSLLTQAKVLRVIETQEFQRVGGNKSIKTDVRIIAATNKNLEREVKKGNFREDLYFRLNVIPLHIPPLRERKEDIPLLVRHFIKTISAEYGRAEKRISDEALQLLMQYDWPGNVRELRNAVERMVIMCPSDEISPKDIPMFKTDEGGDYFSYKTLKEAREAFERDFILKRLKENNWNISKTAEVLNIERSNLYRKIKNYGIHIQT